MQITTKRSISEINITFVQLVNKIENAFWQQCFNKRSNAFIIINKFGDFFLHIFWKKFFLIFQRKSKKSETFFFLSFWWYTLHQCKINWMEYGIFETWKSTVGLTRKDHRLWLFFWFGFLVQISIKPANNSSCKR